MCSSLTGGWGRLCMQVNANYHGLPDDMLGKDEFTLAVRKGDALEGENWEWSNTFRVRPWPAHPTCPRMQARDRLRSSTG